MSCMVPREKTLLSEEVLEHAWIACHASDRLPISLLLVRFGPWVGDDAREGSLCRATVLAPGPLCWAAPRADR